MQAYLKLDHIDKTFTRGNATTEVLKDINLTIEKGEYVSIIGHSGCGKSTLLNIVAGLTDTTQGCVLLENREVNSPGPDRAVVFQDASLLPWRTVLDNTILGMEIQGVPLRQARERALPLLHRYGLAGFEHLYPNSLSGGMRQRAALLRTLLFDTDVILLDEPFGALDAQTKLQMQEWLMQLWSDFDKTVLFVTHDVEEAIYLSDEVHVMGTRPGRVIANIPITLPRPRVRTSALTADFIAIKERCLDLLSANAAAPSPMNQAA